MPSVVNISTTTTITTRSNPFPFQFPPGSPFEDMFKEFGAPQERKSAALGSGFIIDEKGIVVTNNHVIQDAEDIIIRINDDREFKAKVIGADPLSDIAVLQLETNEKFVPVKFGNSDKARIGDWVIAIGNPFGLGGTVTSGIISARNRALGLSRYEDYIQTDASINSGNSGGPLFDMNGDVIGINTAILGRSGSIGIGFAIPSNSAKVVIDQSSGIIVMGQNVKISTVAVAQGNLTIRVTETPLVSQPQPFSQTGTTEVVNQLNVGIDKDQDKKLAIVNEGISLQELVESLNALGVGPRDMISILQSIKAAGALQAEIELF